MQGLKCTEVVELIETRHFEIGMRQWRSLEVVSMLQELYTMLKAKSNSINIKMMQILHTFKMNCTIKH